MISFLKLQKKRKINQQLPQIIVILSGSLVAVSHGMLLSWTSPAIPELIADNSTNITIEDASYLTVISSVSMMITAPIFPLIIDAVGRKIALLLIAVPQLMAWILIGYAKNIWMLYLAKFLAGIGDAALFTTSPIYVGEIAEPQVRGSWGNVVSTSIYFGSFLINVIGAYNNIVMTAFISGFIPVIHIIIFMFMPESPYYLLMKGKENEAQKSLSLLRWRTDVEEELNTMKIDVQRQVSEPGSIKDLFTITSNRKALLICMGVRISQQLSGLTTFEMYTQYLFEKAGGNVTEQVSAMLFTGILFICVTLSAPIVEKLGRRPLMIISCFGCGVVLTIETIYFALIQFTDLDLSVINWLPLAGLLIFIIVCSSGIGIIPTLMLGELFSASIKGKATCVVNIVLGACYLLVPKLFQLLTDNFGIFTPFCLFTLCCYASGLFSYFYVIETKGKSLEEIQQELKGNTHTQDTLSEIKCENVQLKAF